MKRIFFIIPILVLTFTMLYFISCNKSLKTCETCTTQSPDIVQTINMTGKGVTFDVYLDAMTNQKYNTAYAQSPLEDEALRTLYSDFGFTNLKDFSIDKNELNSISLFVNGGISKTKQLNRNDVIGCIFYYTRYGILHELTALKSPTGNLQKSDDLSFPVSSISSNSISSLYYLLSKEYSDSITSLTLMTPKLIPESNIKFKDYSAQIVKLLRQKYHVNSRAPIQDGCKQPCTPNTNSKLYCSTKSTANGSWYHVCDANDVPPDPCVYNEMAAQLVGSGFSFVVDVSVLYSFKDDFLTLNPKGIGYIMDYQKCSNLLMGTHFNYNFMVETINILNQDIIPICRSILDNPNSHVIAFDESRKNRILAYLAAASALNTNTEYQSVITKVTNDINYYVNKPISFISNDFNH